MVALLYRDFEIRKTDPVPPIPGWQAFAWTYCHIDYDGPEDSRIGCCASVSECKAAVDEWHEDIAETAYEHRQQSLMESGGPDDSAYRRDMINAGRGHLLR